MKKHFAHPKKKKNVHVLAMGTFDVLHPGHIYYLSSAKKLGDKLTVIIARDENVVKFKRSASCFDEKARLALVKSLKMVDHALLGDKKDIFAKVKQVRPDIIAMGYDQQPENKVVEKELRARGMNSSVVRIPPFNENEYKSSIIKRRFRAK